MKLTSLSIRFIGLVTLLVSSSVYAWQHEVSAGYGFGQEPTENYNNNAFVLSGKFYKFPKIDDDLIATIEGSVSNLHADTAQHNNASMADVALGLRAYFFNPDLHEVSPYLGISAGPAYLFDRFLGNQEQGAHIAIQATLEGGVEFKLKHDQGIDLNLHFLHYSNAGMFNPNQGFNVPYVLSIGYQF